MNAQMKKLALALVLLAPVCSGGLAATVEPAVGAADQARVPTVTRLVKIFGTLETQWMESVQRRDTAGIERILSDDFEMRIASAPGQPTPRAEWIKQSITDAPFTSSIEQMAAHELGNVIVVSFLWKLDVAESSAISPQVFVVDTWTQEAGTWRVRTRYAAPVGNSGKNVPGAAAIATIIKKKI